MRRVGPEHLSIAIMVSMAHMTPEATGLLVLLGGEGLRAESGELWRQIMAATASGSMSHGVIVPAMLPAQKVGAAEHRARLVAETLAAWGIVAEILPILTCAQANDPAHVARLKAADFTILAGGEPRILIEVLRSSLAWDTMQERQAQGLLLIAMGGAASALGNPAFAPVRPFPQALVNLAFEPVDGLGLLPNMVVLPYFNWLQPQIVEKIEALCAPATCFVGIDAQAALVIGLGGWRAAGLGTLTLWGRGKAKQVIDAGGTVPSDWFSPR